MIVLHIFLLVLLHLGVLAGMLAIIFGLSGNFILLGLALLVGWLGGFSHISLLTLGVMLGLAILGEVVEAFLGIFTARKFGASKWGMIGTFLGGLIGAALGTVWLPLLGSLIGALVGAFGGAFAGEWMGGRGTKESARAGTGAFFGRVMATGFKLGIGVLLAYWILRGAYPLV